MGNKPTLDKSLSGETFKKYYYLKEELVAFCRQEGLQSTGGKLELTNRIAHYLDTGEKISIKAKSKPVSDVCIITEDTLIEKHFICSEKHRAFFKQTIGKSFSFNIPFQKWLKENSGKTYKEAIEAYYKILEDKKRNLTKIDKQFEYNAYIRDFFADNKGKSLHDAIKCWNYKKGLEGHNKYEKVDLIALNMPNNFKGE